MRLDRGKCAAKERPLQPIVASILSDQVGSQIPPFNPEIWMRAVITGKIKIIPLFGKGEAFGLSPQTGKPLRQSLARKK